MARRLALWLMALILLVSGLPYMGVNAATIPFGTVNVEDSLRVRSGPGATYDTVGYLYNGDRPMLLDTTSQQGWYKVKLGDVTGWSSSTYITVDKSYTPDAAFEKELDKQGFPDSYKPYLRHIHAQYPEWKFTAEHLTVTWAEALAAESRVGVNTITAPEAWKSMDYGAYDWSKKTYVSFDSGGWVAADAAVVAYYMDPRNFLDSTYVFQFEDLHYSDGQTKSGIKGILPDALDEHAGALLKASKNTKVSAYFLATRMAQEGSQHNGLGTGTVKGYEGYYNFFHIGAYAHSGRSAVQNGAIYAKNKGWNTPYKCLLGSAEFIGKSYINLGQDTLYYQKYNVVNTTSGLYAHQYMTNVRAAADEGSIRRRSVTKSELNSALTFVIPVYKEMPEAVSPRPSTSGNNNNFLEEIKVDKLSLTPTFDRYTTQYAVQVDENVDTVTVKATLSNKDATLSGDGEITLKHGENEVKLLVTSTSGVRRVYTLTITRDGEGGDEDAKPTVKSKTYALDTTVTGVEPSTTVKKFLNNVTVTNGTAEIHSGGNKKKKSADTVVTGDILKIYDGKTVHSEYPVVIYGDVSCDGKITSLDLRVAQKHILGVTKLGEIPLIAADSGKDGKLTSLDLRITQKHILGITKTLQTKKG